MCVQMCVVLCVMYDKMGMRLHACMSTVYTCKCVCVCVCVHVRMKCMCMHVYGKDMCVFIMNTRAYFIQHMCEYTTSLLYTHLICAVTYSITPLCLPGPGQQIGEYTQEQPWSNHPPLRENTHLQYDPYTMS